MKPFYRVFMFYILVMGVFNLARARRGAAPAKQGLALPYLKGKYLALQVLAGGNRH